MMIIQGASAGKGTDKKIVIEFLSEIIKGNAWWIYPYCHCLTHDLIVNVQGCLHMENHNFDMVICQFCCQLSFANFLLLAPILE